MKRRLVIVTEIISPYRIPLFNALARREDIDLHVIFLAETDPTLRQWRVYKEEIQFSYEVLASWRRRFGRFNVLLNRGVVKALNTAAPDAIVCGGYNYVASWETLRWSRKRNVPLLLWSESNIQDERRGYGPVEFLKRQFVRRCSGFLVPGLSARAYLRMQAIEDGLIFTARNAVDNQLFFDHAVRARQRAGQRRAELNLPGRYFLFVGRLVRDKGIFEMITAYGQLEESIRQQNGLVFVGDGESRAELQRRAEAIQVGKIAFAGFAHRESLADFYALAEALILPTYSDRWGLVVNEAMACGLPVVVSDIAGCVADLVKEDWNGLLVPPRDVASLTAAMDGLARHPERCEMMGKNSLKRIAEYTPEAWASGMVEALNGVLRQPAAIA